MQGQDIKKIRESIGLSQAKFAELLRVSFATVNRWENEKGTPDAETAKQLEGLEQLIGNKKVDLKKVLASIHTAGIASTVTLAAAAGLITFPAISVVLGPLGFVVSSLASLYLKGSKKGR